MNDDKTGAGAPEFPGYLMPCIYSDGVSALSNNANVVKFYLGRYDASLTPGGGAKTQPTAQVVMPIDAFVNAAYFLNSHIARLQKDGLISPERVKAIMEMVHNAG